MIIEITNLQAKQIIKGLKRQLGTKKKDLRYTSQQYEKDLWTELQYDVIMLEGLIEYIRGKLNGKNTNS